MSKKIDWKDLARDPVYIPSEDIPDIELYMDQVTTFMDTRLEPYKRYPEDKILTKTMINNYTKNRLLPPSAKKKYSKEHFFMLIFIYHLKNMLSIADIQTLLEPVSESFFSSPDDSGLTLEEIYNRINDMCAARHPEIMKEISHIYDITTGSCSDYDLSEEDGDYLDTFFFIFQLCYDIYVRKQLVEKLIDRYRDSHPEAKGREKSRKRKK